MESADKEAGWQMCEEPTFFEYYALDGAIWTIKVPREIGSAQKIAYLHFRKNHTALDAYED